MRLTAVGTSGSFPGPGNSASCYLLTWQAEGRDWRVVLDLGSGALGALQAHVDPADLDAVVLSHLHPDHCLDMTGLYVHRIYDPRTFCDAGDGGEAPAAPVAEARADAGTQPLAAVPPPRTPLPVWGPGGTEQRIAWAHHTEPGLSPDADTAHPTDLGAAFDFRTLTDRAPFELGSAHFEPFLVRHPVECYALRVTAPSGGTLVYSGDTDECTGLDEAAAGADVLLCEAAFEEDRDTVRGVHLTGLRAGRTAQRAGAARLVLTHIPPWTREHIVRAEAESAYSGPLDVAAPGASWDIPNGRNPL